MHIIAANRAALTLALLGNNGMQRFKFLSIILFAAVLVIMTVLVLVLLGIIPGRRPPSIPETTLEIWGVFDDPVKFRQLTEGFTKQGFYKKVKITYTEKFIDEYEDELVDALAAGRGPDIFMVHNSWLPKHENKMDPWPMDEFIWKGSLLGPMTARDYLVTFVDTATNDFVNDGKIYALPLYVDTLALYYNKDMFNTAGIPEPPTTWEELAQFSRTLTRFDAKGNVARPGITLGSAENINRATDILSLLFLQDGNPIIDTSLGRKESMLTRKGRDMLDFYTGFAKQGNPNYSWNYRGPYSIDAFYGGNAAMMINYSHHLKTLYEKNPNFRFDVAPMPQVQGSVKDINYANYWGLAVAANSSPTERKVAHEFIRWMSKKENMQTYAELFEHPISRRDLLLWQGLNYQQLGVFSKQALSAVSWYQPDSRRVETIFKDMIESVVKGERTVDEALQKAEDELRLLLR